jgi:hypothetical protein
MEQLNQIFSQPLEAVLLVIWTLFWKGWALWRAARNEQKIWFAALLILNLLGILEITYLLFFQKEDKLWQKIFVSKGKTKSKK